MPAELEIYIDEQEAKHTGPHAFNRAAAADVVFDHLALGLEFASAVDTRCRLFKGGEAQAFAEWGRQFGKVPNGWWHTVEWYVKLCGLMGIPPILIQVEVDWATDSDGGASMFRIPSGWQPASRMLAFEALAHVTRSLDAAKDFKPVHYTVPERFVRRHTRNVIQCQSCIAGLPWRVRHFR